MDALAPRDWSPLLIPVAEEAGRAILAVYEGPDFDVTRKGDGSPLTAADLAAHRVIVDRLQAATPDIPVLTEESAEVPWATRRTWTTLWLVDPLDGTKEFLKRNGEFTVNIALIHEGVPRAGVVHAPALRRTYYGQGGRAFRTIAGNREEIQAPTLPTHRPLRVVASRSHTSPETEAFLSRLPAHELVAGGSSLKFCRLAEGEADLYPRLAPTMEWDTAAGQAVLEGAGGEVRAADGGRMRYNKENLLNPHFLAASDPKWFGAGREVL